MSQVDDELERRVSERLAGLDTMTFQRREASAARRPDVRGFLVVAGCLAAIALAVVLVTSRHEPAPAVRITTAPAPPADWLGHLPALRPGELRGELRAIGQACVIGTVDLATLQQATIPFGVCARPGAAIGVQGPITPDDRTIQVTDLAGRPAGTVAMPTRATLLYWTRDGLIFSDHMTADDRPAPGSHCILRRFDGAGDVQLPTCPFAHDLDGGEPLFRSADGRDVVDLSGRLLAHASAPIAADTPMLIITEHLFAAARDLYRDGRLVASFGEPGGQIFSASADGRVVLMADTSPPPGRDRSFPTTVSSHLALYRDGRRSDIDAALDTTGGAVAPDGRHLLVKLKNEPQVLVQLDAATLRPLARLDLNTEFAYPGDPGIEWTWR